MSSALNPTGVYRIHLPSAGPRHNVHVWTSHGRKRRGRRIDEISMGTCSPATSWSSHLELMNNFQILLKSWDSGIPGFSRIWVLKKTMAAHVFQLDLAVNITWWCKECWWSRKSTARQWKHIQGKSIIMIKIELISRKAFKKNFFFLNCSWCFLYNFSFAAPQRTAYSKVPSQMAAHLMTGSLL
jgi:hypothetical protein